MKKSVILAAVAAAIALGLPAQAAESAATTAARHIAKGIACASCHADEAKALPVRQDKCLPCHGGSYPAVARRTAKIQPNPHYNHFGDRDCSTCHKGHGPSVTTCDQCHKFDLKTP